MELNSKMVKTILLNMTIKKDDIMYESTEGQCIQRLFSYNYSRCLKKCGFDYLCKYI